MSEKANSQVPSTPARKAGSDYDYIVWARTVWLPKEDSEVKKFPDYSRPSGIGRRGAFGQLVSKSCFFQAQTEPAL